MGGYYTDLVCVPWVPMLRMRMTEGHRFALSSSPEGRGPMGGYCIDIGDVLWVPMLRMRMTGGAPLCSVILA
jgi:hypothetical protein